MSLQRGSRDRDRDDASAERDGELAPGRRTLTSRLAARTPAAARRQDDLPPVPEAEQAHWRDKFGIEFDEAGRPIHDAVPFQSEMEHAFGEDFSGVKTRLGAHAEMEQQGAHAVARGEELTFASSSPDRHLVAHELTHVIQQRRGGTAVAQGKAIDPGMRGALETEADAVAGRVAAGHSAGAIHGVAPGVELRDDRADVLPAPVTITWHGDPFRVSFSRIKSDRIGDAFVVEVRYTGGLPTADGDRSPNGVLRFETPTVQLRMSTPPFKATVKQGGDVIDVDLYGDDIAHMKISDQMEVRAAPDPDPGRRHHIDAKVLGRTVGGTWLLVRDKTVKPQKITPPEYQGDVPGEQPLSLVKDGGTQIRIDGDGDQHKELLLFLRQAGDHPPKSVVVDVTQLASGKKQTVTLGLSPVGGELFPVLRQITNGHVPTVIALQRIGSSLQVFPPNRTKDAVTYTFQGPVDKHDVAFPPEPEGKGPEKIATAGDVMNIGGLFGVDIRLGAYRDAFRVSLDPATSTLGISAKNRAPKGALYQGLGTRLAHPATRFRVVTDNGVSVGLDLHGAGRIDVEIFDTMTALGRDPEMNRKHVLRLVGRALAEERELSFTIKNNDFMGPGTLASDLDQAVASNAQALTGLADQEAVGDFQQNIDAFADAMVDARRQASEAKVITQATYDAWKKLSGDLQVLRSYIRGTGVTPALRERVASEADAFLAALAAETKDKVKTSIQGGRFSTVVTEKNPYTGESKTTTSSAVIRVTSNADEMIGAKIRATKYDEAFDAYTALVRGLDRWIIDTLAKKVDGPAQDASKRLEYMGAMHDELKKIESHKPVRIQAVFHPAAIYKEAQRIKEVPLSLYYWKEKDHWILRDLTNPKNAFEDKEPFEPGDTEPPKKLFEKLDHKTHFPKGIIHYQIPFGHGGQLATTERRTLSEWLTYIGLGVAAVGLTLASFGTAAPTVAAVGTYVLAASSLIGAGAALAHAVEESQHGHLSDGALALDIAQVVAGVMGAGSLASGRIMMDARAASMAGKAWVGPLATLSKWAQAGYKPLTIMRIGADIATVPLASAEIAKQLDEIEASGAPPDEKSRLKALLLAQGAATVGLVGLSIKGDLPNLAKGKPLYFYVEHEGGPIVAAHVEKPGNLAFSQATIAPKTSDGLSLDELTASMKKNGWQGKPLDVVQLDGKLVSIDNRRLYAARAAGIEPPVKVHVATEKLPVEMVGEDPRFPLKVDVWEAPDKTLTTVKPDGAVRPKYVKGTVAETWGEAAIFRTANQEELTGIKFQIGGERDVPFVTVSPMKAADRKQLEIPKTQNSNDVARIQTKNLVASIEDGTLDKNIFTTKASDGSTFSSWYKRWIEGPEPVTIGHGGTPDKINYPNGMPSEFEPLIQKMVAQGEVTKNLKIRAQAQQLAHDIPDLHLDPKDPKYGASRKKLVDKYGEDVVAHYESATFGVAGTPGREKVFAQVKKIVGDDGVATIREWLPGQEIYVTGATATPGQPATSIDRIKMLIVVADGTGAGKIAELEAKASALVVNTSPEFASATGKGHLRVEATVRPRRDAFAAMMSEPSGQFARIDAHVPSTVELAAGYGAAKAHAGAQAAEQISPEAVKALTEGLPGVKIDPKNPKIGIQDWLTKELKRKPGEVIVEELGGGMSGAQVFKVTTNRGETLGIFKIFRDKEEMLREIGSLTKIRPVGIDHAANVAGGAKPTGGALMEAAGGTIVKDKLKTVAGHPVGSSERTAVVAALKHDVEQVAKGMAEMHTKLSAGRDVDTAFKNSEIRWLRDKWNTAVAQKTIPASDQGLIEPLLAKLEVEFRKAKIDATVVHGDGHIGNFAVQGNKVNVIDTETLFRSVAADGKGTSPAATDVGRFYESISVQGKAYNLDPKEIESLQKAYLDAYKAAVPGAAGADFQTSMKFYEVNYDLIHLRTAAVEAKAKGQPIDRVAVDRVIKNLQ
jgi:aminoglycoside phosphotransferase (APT) family kinase protein